MHYTLAHLLHVACVSVSITLFVLRGALMAAGSPKLRMPLLRVLPHVVDTLLLASALWLVSVLHLPLLHTPWITAKVAGLMLYIVLGSVALRYGRSRGVRIAAFIAALATVTWIVSVAVTHDPLGLFVLTR